ncbi:hypothetical protein CHS0354_030978 [Potamilus streckersoni]|uniref:GyrI-like small molecule binding domain-containing protein n=1 Tax=Potamilus streckersoni TaxID=2493646 RepID=A0AAE0SF02_9BIVA|nr:hypothetical protein CHS0354_030978 [Potamilus streckersoni]
MALVLILAGIGALFLLLIFTLSYLIAYLGLFESVEVGAGKPPIGKALVLYKYGQGPYKECGHMFTDVCRLAPNCKPIGIYYDDPKVVPEQKLRYAIGTILSEDGSTVDEDLQKKMIDEGYKVIHLPAVSNAVKTTFPFKSSISIYIAIYKVYPKLCKYIQEHRLSAFPMLEVYDKETIHFMAPLAHQYEFFVDESKCDAPDEYQEEDDQSVNDQTFIRDFSEGDVSTSKHNFAETLDDDSSSEEEQDDAVIQDQEVTSSMILPAVDGETEEGTSRNMVDSPAGDCSLINSGISLERTLAVADQSLEVDNQNESESEGSASTSSFEEIHLEEGHTAQRKS